MSELGDLSGLAQAVFESTNDAMLIANDSGRYVAANAAASELLGIPHAELLGLCVRDVMPAGHDVAGAWEAFLAAGSARGELELLHRDGSSRHVDFRATANVQPRLHLSVLRDMTSTKVAERRLAESERRFRLVVESSADVVYITDPKRFSYVSPSSKALFGYDPAALIGRETDAFVHPDDRHVVAGALAATLETPQGVSRAKFRALHADGSYRVVEVSARNLLDEPTVRGVVINIHDVTEREKAQEELRRSEASLRESQVTLEKAQGIAHIGSWITKGSEGNTFCSCSAETLRIYGIDEATFRGELAELQAVFAPEDWTRAAAAIAAAMGTRSTFDVEASIRRRGEQRWVRLQGYAEADPAAEGALRLVGTTLDITDRRRSEQDRARASARDLADRRHVDELRARLAAIVESSDDAIMATSLERVIVSWNAAAERLYGYSSQEVIGRSAAILDAPGSTEQIAAMLALVARGERAAHAEVARRRKDGSVLDVSMTMSAIRGPDGAIDGVSAIAHDITERARAERAERSLRETEEQLRQVQKLEAVGQLAGGVAHDFNNILSVILGYTTIVMDELPVQDLIRADVAEIHAAGLRAAELTKQLLAFSRKQVLEPRIVDMDEVLGKNETMLRRLLGEDIELSLTRSPSPIAVRADPTQLEQVLLNLAVNARDAMPNGGRLLVELSAVDLTAVDALREGVPAGPYASLTVADTGIGMDEAVRARIFEPFFTTKRQGEGTGLGLSTVFGIVKQSAGHILVRSALGQGTTFQLLLSTANAAVDAPVPAAGCLLKARAHETVLLVEDEDQVRVLACNVLRRAGYTVLGAANAGEAMLISEQHAGPIHILVTDVVMPRMGGHPLAMRLRAIRPDMKVLFMSGYTDDTVLKHGVELGQLEFLAKPFTPNSLTRKVRGVLDGA